MAAYIPDSSDASDQLQGGGRRLYNPYHSLHNPYRHIYDIATSPEFLFEEQANVHHRSWSENLTYYTGISYLVGSAAGASYGVCRGLKAAERGDTTKIRVNRVLNSFSHEGRALGNRLGFLGLMYAGMESGISSFRGTDDWASSVYAGLGTGALFRAARGVRSAAVAGALGGLMVGAAFGAKQMVRRYVPNIPV